MGSIASIGAAGSTWLQRSPMQEKLFAKVDADSSGSVNSTELQSMLDDVGTKTGQSFDSKALFTSMDTNSDGSLGQEELADGMRGVLPPPPTTMEFAQSRGMSDSGEPSAPGEANAAGQPPGGPGGMRPAGGPPPGGGPGAAGGPGGGSGGGPGGAPGAGSATSQTNATYDPLDTNEDGEVSEQERLAGEIKKAAEEAATEEGWVTLLQQVYEPAESTSTVDTMV
ncbi:EF-hand domain-containing protein [Candidatus Symbiobacter mobilis]|uniref:Calcium-binding EF-hand-like protein n=1 Tax=Candidatus Symbiobacter mobilis CR TaxID=946483 RepID=U5N8G1_9BURK|nr:EF-hand domain-containing protein [Candidatus Symbiobacter mobilis]AGX86553.1 calcium-binding EF-hand-like protein [Candidatus Symbiobacter mobilis CR]